MKYIWLLKQIPLQFSFSFSFSFFSHSSLNDYRVHLFFLEAPQIFHLKHLRNTYRFSSTNLFSFLSRSFRILHSMTTVCTCFFLEVPQMFHVKHIRKKEVLLIHPALHFKSLLSSYGDVRVCNKPSLSQVTPRPV